MKQFTDLTNLVLTKGEDRKNVRTGEMVRSIFGHQMRFDLQECFPLVNQKFTAFYATTSELLWFLSGCTDNNVLHKFNNTIWDEWETAKGTLPLIYGHQWRNWKSFEVIDLVGDSWENDDGSTGMVGTFTTRLHDQLTTLIKTIQTNPSDRGMILSAWNVGDLDRMALRPCHTLSQFYVSPLGKLSCQLYQRSGDVGLGIPFNIASYALLTHIIARICNLEVGEFIHTIGDAHIYHSHIDGMAEMLSRPEINPEAKLWISPELRTLEDFSIHNFVDGGLPRLKELFRVDNYVYHPKIDLPVAI